MAVAHIKSTGSKSSGLSTPDDWTDANCYSPDDIATAVAAMANGDSLIFDDETLTDSLSLNATTTDAGITITSRSGSSVLIPASVSARLFLNTSGTNNAQFAFVGPFAFDGTGVTWSSASQPLVLLAQTTGDCSFTDITWSNWDFGQAARTVGVLARMAANATDNTMTLTDCILTDIDLDNTGNFPGLFEIESVSGLKHTWSFSGLSCQNVDLRTSSGFNYGIISHDNDRTVSIIDTTLTAIHVEGVAGVSIGGFYRAATDTGVVTISGVDVNGFTFGGDASTQAILRIQATATARHLYVDGLIRSGREASSGGNSAGGLFQVTGDAGIATIEDVTVKNSQGHFGVICDSTGGGSVTIRRAVADTIDDNDQLNQGGTDKVNGQGLYAGGHGAATWENCVVVNVTGDATNGVGIYGHNTDTTGTASKSILIRACTFASIESVAATRSACYFNNATAAEVLTTTITNTIFDNGDLDLEGNETDGTHNLTLVNCHVTGDTGAIDTSAISVGAVDTGTLTTGDPKLTANGRLNGNSPCLAAGTEWWSGEPPQGPDGLRCFNTPSIGAYELRAQSGYARGAGALVGNTLPAGVELGFARAA